MRGKRSNQYLSCLIEYSHFDGGEKMEELKKNKKNLIIMLICLFLTVVILFISFVVTTLFEKKNESTTIEYQATFIRTEKDKNNYIIYVKEYDCKLMLISSAIINIDYLTQLENGNIIYFRIVKEAEKLLENLDIEQIGVVALKDNVQDIITLDSYNEVAKRQIINIRITGTIFASIFLLGAIINIVKYKQKNYNII